MHISFGRVHAHLQEILQKLNIPVESAIGSSTDRRFRSAYSRVVVVLVVVMVSLIGMFPGNRLLGPYFWMSLCSASRCSLLFFVLDRRAAALFVDIFFILDTAIVLLITLTAPVYFKQSKEK
jgi:hypothetical protein